MLKNFLEKTNKLKSIFSSAKDIEAKYLLIMELGKKLPPLPEIYKTPENLVDGCQSTTYIYTNLKNNLMYLQAESDALISSGLASLLISVYNEEKPEIIIKNPPLFLEEIGIQNSISPSRANGLHGMYIKLKQNALKFLSL
jgi:cysteine desulfuration protein SufE